MSDIIQLLPDSVANQIAAGEVIQRPASVIKELVENAVDAGATAINVLVTDAGRTAIQVIDNGKGMSETDARLAFERHATSKIRKADDLFTLHTMGFRGEALASIAAVAQVELKTRRSDDEIGTHISIAGSKVSSQQPVACPAGSNFSISNLFYNVPARRKFLKTNATELNNIMTAYERIVLVYPEIAFTLHSNGTELLNLRKGNLRHRITEIFGKKFSQDLLPVKVETSMCNIEGYIGKPEAARKKTPHQYFFVNGRYMKHQYFHKAVVNAYDRMVPEGSQVPYLIYLTVPAEDIDVNIHPTKTEIKFENENPIWQILTTAAKDALGNFCEVPTIDFDTEGQPEIPVFTQDDIPEPPKPAYNPDYNPFNTAASRKVQAPANWDRLYQKTQDPEQHGSTLFGDEQLPDDDGLIASKATRTDSNSPQHFQFKERYIMTAVKSGLMIIDQNRADIRIRYEKFLKKARQHSNNTQQTLFPEVVQFAPSDSLLVKKILPDLQALGFELTDLGQNSYAVNGVPAECGSINFVAMLQNIVDNARDRTTAGIGKMQETLAMSIAENTAVKHGDKLSAEQMENIVNELFSCENANYTPDGKTITCILQQKDIEDLLG